MLQWLARLQTATGRHASAVQYSTPVPPQSSSTPIPSAEQEPAGSSEPPQKPKKGGLFSRGRKS